jgi:hypothetical protein
MPKGIIGVWSHIANKWRATRARNASSTLQANTLKKGD